MFKKTTVYLSEDDLRLVRKRSIVDHVTVAEAIRNSIQESCKPKSKAEKTVWDSLDRIWAKTENFSFKDMEIAVDRAIKEVRDVKKARRHTR